MSIRSVAIPAVLLFIVVLMFSLERFGLIPGPTRLLSAVDVLLVGYGLVAIFLLSSIENIVGVNVYFPGSIVILLAMAKTGGDLPLAIKTFAAIYCGAMLAYCINYLIGVRLRHGMLSGSKPYAPPVPSPYSRYLRFFLTALSFGHPHFAALTCLRQGLAGVRVSRFALIVLTFGTLWNCFWGWVMYKYGVLAFSKDGDGPLVYLVILYLLLWFLYELVLLIVRRPSSFEGRTPDD